MTITGAVRRYATLRSGPYVATVTRCSPEDGPTAYLVEHTGPYGPVYTPVMDWRKALELAANAVAEAVARSVTNWQ